MIGEPTGIDINPEVQNPQALDQADIEREVPSSLISPEYTPVFQPDEFARERIESTIQNEVATLMDSLTPKETQSYKKTATRLKDWVDNWEEPPSAARRLLLIDDDDPILGEIIESISPPNSQTIDRGALLAAMSQLDFPILRTLTMKVKTSTSTDDSMEIAWIAPREYFSFDSNPNQENLEHLWTLMNVCPQDFRTLRDFRYISAVEQTDDIMLAGIFVNQEMTAMARIREEIASPEKLTRTADFLEVQKTDDGDPFQDKAFLMNLLEEAQQHDTENIMESTNDTTPDEIITELKQIYKNTFWTTREEVANLPESLFDPRLDHAYLQKYHPSYRRNLASGNIYHPSAVYLRYLAYKDTQTKNPPSEIDKTLFLSALKWASLTSAYIVIKNPEYLHEIESKSGNPETPITQIDRGDPPILLADDRTRLLVVDWIYALYKPELAKKVLTENFLSKLLEASHPSNTRFMKAQYYKFMLRLYRTDAIEKEAEQFYADYDRDEDKSQQIQRENMYSPGNQARECFEVFPEETQTRLLALSGQIHEALNTLTQTEGLLDKEADTYPYLYGRVQKVRGYAIGHLTSPWDIREHIRDPTFLQRASKIIKEEITSIKQGHGKIDIRYPTPTAYSLLPDTHPISVDNLAAELATDETLDMLLACFTWIVDGQVASLEFPSLDSITEKQTTAYNDLRAFLTKAADRGNQLAEKLSLPEIGKIEQRSTLDVLRALLLIQYQWRTENERMFGKTPVTESGDQLRIDGATAEDVLRSHSIVKNDYVPPQVELEPGRVQVVSGPTGVGKSTLGSAILAAPYAWKAAASHTGGSITIPDSQSYPKFSPAALGFPHWVAKDDRLSTWKNIAYQALQLMVGDPELIVMEEITGAAPTDESVALVVALTAYLAARGKRVCIISHEPEAIDVMTTLAGLGAELGAGLGDSFKFSYMDPKSRQLQPGISGSFSIDTMRRRGFEGHEDLLTVTEQLIEALDAGLKEAVNPPDVRKEAAMQQFTTPESLEELRYRTALEQQVTQLATATGSLYTEHTFKYLERILTDPDKTVLYKYRENVQRLAQVDQDILSRYASQASPFGELLEELQVSDTEIDIDQFIQDHPEILVSLLIHPETDEQIINYEEISILDPDADSSGVLNQLNALSTIRARLQQVVAENKPGLQDINIDNSILLREVENFYSFQSTSDLKKTLGPMLRKYNKDRADQAALMEVLLTILKHPDSGSKIVATIAKAIGQHYSEEIRAEFSSLSVNNEAIGTLCRLNNTIPMAELSTNPAFCEVVIGGTTTRATKLSNPVIGQTDLPISFEYTSVGSDGEHNSCIGTGLAQSGKTSFLQAYGLAIVTYALTGKVQAEEFVIPKAPTSLIAQLTVPEYVGLSTFNGVARHLVEEIIDKAGSDTLVLLDQPAPGTKTRDTAAITAMLLEYLRRKGALPVITTHATQTIECNEAFVGARDPALLGFGRPEDPKTSHASITTGEVGGAEALTIAEETGVPKEICELARMFQEIVQVYNQALEEVVNF
ncbi:hypothetical protein GF357_04765 [Candidatus Dojkabacteria bacterium]|nr:hypothetical protein [Candidatus Dojkabacteria bacterium]